MVKNFYVYIQKVGILKHSYARCSPEQFLYLHTILVEQFLLEVISKIILLLHADWSTVDINGLLLYFFSLIYESTGLFFGLQCCWYDGDFFTCEPTKYPLHCSVLITVVYSRCFIMTIQELNKQKTFFFDEIHLLPFLFYEAY